MPRPPITKSEFDKLTDALAFETQYAVVDYRMYEDLAKAAEENEIVVIQSRAFWGMTIDAHLNSAVLRLCRVYDQQVSSMNLSKWLRLIKSNPSWLRDPADPTQLEQDIEYVSNRNPKVQNLTTYRGNAVAHLGESYVLDFRGTRQSFKLTYADLKELVENGLKIVNRYGTLYKGHSWSPNLVGADDYQFIFRELKKAVEKYRAEHEAEIQKVPTTDGEAMRGEYIFDLPVYRCSKERHEKEMDEAVERHLRTCFDEHGLPRSTDPETVTTLITAHANDSFGGPWEFNEIVGWVRLFPESYGIGAHVWFTEGKKLTRKMRKLFRLRTWSNSLWTHFPPPVENSEIYDGDLKALKDLAKRDPVKGRVLDLSVFHRIGPYVDWRRLIEEAAKGRLSSDSETAAVAPPRNPP